MSAAGKATTEEVREAFAALGPGEQKKAPLGDPMDVVFLCIFEISVGRSGKLWKYDNSPWDGI